MSEAAPQETAPPRRRSCARTLLRLTVYSLVLLLLLTAGAALGAYMIFDHVTRPSVGGEAVRVDIPEGVTGAQAGDILYRQDLVEHPLFFRLAIRLDHSGKSIKHGTYDLQHGLSPTQLLQRLQEGPDVTVSKYKLTIPEGLTLKQMADLFPNPVAFIEAAKDPARIASLGIAANSLEGFLMPDTYFFDEQPGETQVVDRMLEHFHDVYERAVATIPEAAGHDLLEVVTVASLVEEESRVDDERPIVAAVVYNRLRRGMPLDMDSTLQYALDKYGQRLLDRDKEVESPYNTYRNAGLPPGPISNPGAAALRAALAPADVDYLYFVSNADGRTHTFSATLSEHNRAVARYRREIAEQRRELQQEQHADHEEEHEAPTHTP